MIAVTMHLFAGRQEDATSYGLVHPGVYTIEATWTPTVPEAMRVLHSGGSAIIPLVRWEEMARSILVLMGEPPEHVRSILHRAAIYERASGDPAEGFVQ